MGVALLDTDGRYRRVNGVLCELLGRSEDEMLRLRWHEVTHPDDVPAAERFASRIHAGQDHGYHVERRYLRPDGEVVHVGLSVAVLREDGVPIGFFAVIADRTDQKLIEAQQERAVSAMTAALVREQEAAERLRVLDQMKTTFLSAVSHDLRSPLATVMGFASILKDNAGRISEEDRITYLDQIIRGAEKIDRLLTDLLDLDRIRRGDLTAARRPTDVGTLVRRVIQDDLRWRERVKVEAMEVVALVEAEKVERIVENLVVNALKHTPPGTNVWVQASAREQDLILVVEDDGPGVPESAWGTLFDPFTRAPAGDTPGTGIGLSLVSGFAGLHGGSARIEQRAGGGARFVVTFPDALVPASETA